MLNRTDRKEFDIDEMRAELWGSFLFYCQVMFPYVTGREFILSNPAGRESHFVTIARELTSTFRREQRDILINVPPGHAKSTLLSLFVSWSLSRYPDCNFIYISYSHSLAAKHTEFIKRIMNTVYYKDIFDVHIRSDARAKDFFQTTAHGAVAAFGSAGAITGRDAGLPGLDRFSGAVIIDDIHKPDEVHSDTIRERVIDNYKETILQRCRAPEVPIICIGQRLHEDDLCAHLMSDESERTFKRVVLKALDDAGNVLCPEIITKEMLQKKQELSSYVFASQYQQDPLPKGGAIFKEKDFLLLDEEPEIIATFITADTAETNKSYNDATAFGFWGIYKVKEFGHDTGQLAVHSLDAQEIRVEPKQLKDAFMSFYGDCMLHKVKPLIAAIEKKSTGVTLLSILEDIRGLQLREVKRTKASGSKTDRYLEMQPVVAAKLVTFTEGARHAKMYIDHMTKITANGTHRHDDLADAMYDCVKIALIDKTIVNVNENRNKNDIADKLAQHSQRILNASQSLYG